MADKQPPDAKTSGELPAVPAAPTTTPPRRSPGHRGADVRDTVAEMAAKAQEISQEAGSRMAAVMKDVINAAAGIADFAVESARDLAQYMVRRGQMTQEEADKLIREAEAAQAGRPTRPKPPPTPTPASTERVPTPAASQRAVPPTPAPRPSVPTPAPSAATPVGTPAVKSASRPTPAKPVHAAPVAKKAAAHKSEAKAAKKGAAKPAAKKAAKPPAKKAKGGKKR